MVEISNSWPVWLIAMAVFLMLLPGATKGLAIFIPPLRDWIKARGVMETREDVLLASQLDRESFNLQQDSHMITRLLNVVEQTLQDRAQAAKDNMTIMKELQRAINNQTLIVERNTIIVSALNGSITGLSDQMDKLSVKLDSLQWYVVGRRDGVNMLEKQGK